MGHIGISWHIFMQIRGYGETFPPMAGQDKDTFVASVQFKMPQPKELWPIPNDKAESLLNSDRKADDWHKISKWSLI